MIGKCLEHLSNTIAIAFLILVIINKKHRKVWIAALVLATAATLLLGYAPIENAFYSFPTAEAVANYACRGEVIEILEGEESSMILYAPKPGDVSFMLSNKTEKGYKIGCWEEMKRHTHTIPGPGMQALISESTHGIDKYVYATGNIDGVDVTVEDTQNSSFFVFQESSSLMGKEYTYFRVYCMLNDPEYEEYALTINSTAQSVTLKAETN